MAGYHLPDRAALTGGDNACHGGIDRPTRGVGRRRHCLVAAAGTPHATAGRAGPAVTNVSHVRHTSGAGITGPLEWHVVLQTAGPRWLPHMMYTAQFCYHESQRDGGLALWLQLCLPTATVVQVAATQSCQDISMFLRATTAARRGRIDNVH